METLDTYQLQHKIFLLCMKGIAIQTGERLSQIVERHADSSNKVAVWLGPGHVQDFYSGKPNCMVIDSQDSGVKNELIQTGGDETKGSGGGRAAHLRSST